MANTTKQYKPSKIIFQKIYFAGLILLPIVLLVLPADFFDTGQSMCLSVLIFNQRCYACGMTRAIQHLIHFDFKAAYNYNWLSFIVLPLLILLWVQELRRTYKKIKKVS